MGHQLRGVPSIAGITGRRFFVVVERLLGIAVLPVDAPSHVRGDALQISGDLRRFSTVAIVAMGFAGAVANYLDDAFGVNASVANVHHVSLLGDMARSG